MRLRHYPPDHAAALVPGQAFGDFIETDCLGLDGKFAPGHLLYKN